MTPRCLWCGERDRATKVHATAVHGPLHERCMSAAHAAMCEHYWAPILGVHRCPTCHRDDRRKEIERWAKKARKHR